MPRKKKAEADQGSSPPKGEGLWKDWTPPTRAPHLVDNPFASLSLEDARMKVKELYPQLRQIQWEIAQLERITLSYNIRFIDPEGNIRAAV